MRRVALLISLFAMLHLGFQVDSSLAYEKEIRRMCSDVSENIAKEGKRKITVRDFTDLNGNTSELGRFLAEEFSVTLTEIKKGYQVVDRVHLKAILQEHKLAETGLIDTDPSTTKKLGKIAGVDAIVIGTITPFPENVKVAVKVLDTGTAMVIAASRGEISRTRPIEELLSKGLSSGTVSSPSTSANSPQPSSPPPSSSSYSQNTNPQMQAAEAMKGFANIMSNFSAGFDRSVDGSRRPQEYMDTSTREMSVPISLDELTNTEWVFGQIDGAKKGKQIGRVRFLRDGNVVMKIEDTGEAYQRSNFVRWEIAGNNLLFYNSNGRPATQFNSFSKKDGRWIISGPSLLYDGNRTNVLQEPKR